MWRHIPSQYTQYRYLITLFFSSASLKVRPSNLAASSIRSRFASVSSASSASSSCWFCLTIIHRITCTIEWCQQKWKYANRIIFTICQKGAQAKTSYSNEHRLVIVRTPLCLPDEGTYPIHSGQISMNKVIRIWYTHRFPIFPKPFTIPIAAERFEGGRGIALDTHTSVRAKPRYHVNAGLYNDENIALATIAAGHKEHSDISTTNWKCRNTDNISYYGAPPPTRNVEEPFTCPVYIYTQ